MTRRMSVSMTLEAVRAEIKTVTRRHEDSWVNLKVGDHLVLIEKGMGLPKGAKQVVVTEVEIVANDLVPLWPITIPELAREGLLDRARAETGNMPLITGSDEPMLRWFCTFWLAGHGYKAGTDPASVTCRRIVWRYLDA